MGTDGKISTEPARCKKGPWAGLRRVEVSVRERLTSLVRSAGSVCFYRRKSRVGEQAHELRELRLRFPSELLACERRIAAAVVNVQEYGAAMVWPVLFVAPLTVAVYVAL